MIVAAVPLRLVEVADLITIRDEGMAVTVNVWALEALVPGFITVTESVPTEVISEAFIATVTCVAETKVVVLAAPFQSTVEDALKFVPLTVRVKADVPTMVDVGVIEVVVGVGTLFTVIVLLRAEVTLADVAQIFMLCAVEYCIAVYVITPAVIVAPLAGVEVSVPLPDVPPHD